MSRKFGAFFLTLGILLLISALGLVCYNTWESQSAAKASETVLTELRSVAVEASKTKTGENPYANHVDRFDELAAEMTEKEINGYSYIGYLTIPVLELELPVMSQWDYSRLKIAPCRQFGSTKTDDLVIAAHNYSTHFGNLTKLCAGDLLTFTDMDGEVILYSVEAVDILEPSARDQVKNSGFDLVLYTCTYGGEKRVCVFCNRVGD